jgi:hypothetical protein
MLDMDNINENSESKAIAGNVFDKLKFFLNNDTNKKANNSKIVHTDDYTENDKIIAVIGSWGTGKTTIKNLLKNNLDQNRKNIIIATYNALQFEEKSQVTSELYNEIAKSFSFKLFNVSSWLWSYCIKAKFRAIAQLKKESTAHLVSTSQIWSIFVIGFATFILSKINKLPWFNDLLFSRGIIPIQNAVLGNKLLCSLIILGLIFLIRHWLLGLIAGMLPRKSHVDILRSMNFGDKKFILLIDEIDRLSPESTKLLFDEILIIKEAFNETNEKQESKQINYKIFMFYDEAYVMHSYHQLKIYEPHIFLQKFYDRQYRIARDIFIDELNNCISKIMPTTRIRPNQNYPTIEIIKHIALNISSYREKERLIQFINGELANKVEYTFNLGNSMMKKFDIDLVLFGLSLNFFYDLKNLYNEDNQIYSNYLSEGIKIFENTYSIDSKELSNQISRTLIQLFSKPHILDKQFSQDLIIQSVLLKPSTELDIYCNNIVIHLEYLHWEGLHGWIQNNTNNKNIFKEWLKNSNFNITNLIITLSETLQNSIITYYLRAEHNYSDSYIKAQYSIRIKCMRFFLYIYAELNGSIDEFFIKQHKEKLDCLLIASLLEFNENEKLLDENKKYTTIHWLLKFTNQDGADLKCSPINIIASRVSSLKNAELSELLDINSFYLYQAIDLIWNLKEIQYILEDSKFYDLGKYENIILSILVFRTNPLGVGLNTYSISKEDHKVTSNIINLFKDKKRYNTQIQALIEKPEQPEIEFNDNRSHYG